MGRPRPQSSSAPSSWSRRRERRRAGPPTAPTGGNDARTRKRARSEERESTRVRCNLREAGGGVPFHRRAGHARGRHRPPGRAHAQSPRRPRRATPVRSEEENAPTRRARGSRRPESEMAGRTFVVRLRTRRARRSTAWPARRGHAQGDFVVFLAIIRDHSTSCSIYHHHSSDGRRRDARNAPKVSPKPSGPKPTSAPLCRDGMERVEIPAATSRGPATVADVRAAAAVATGLPPAILRLSAEQALLRGSGTGVALLDDAGPAPPHGSVVFVAWPPDATRLTTVAGAVAPTVTAAEQMNLSRLAARWCRVERQETPRCTAAVLSPAAAGEFQRYLQSVTRFGVQRGGVLYGTREGSGDGESGAASVAEVIYEPPQVATPTSLEMEPWWTTDPSSKGVSTASPAAATSGAAAAPMDANNDAVEVVASGVSADDAARTRRAAREEGALADKVASLLGLERVGWILAQARGGKWRGRRLLSSLFCLLRTVLSLFLLFPSTLTHPSPSLFFSLPLSPPPSATMRSPGRRWRRWRDGRGRPAAESPLSQHSSRSRMAARPCTLKPTRFQSSWKNWWGGVGSTLPLAAGQRGHRWTVRR